jgi:ribosome maturation factor RimP
VNERLHATVQECVNRHGAHLIDLVLRGDRRRRVIQVFVDAEQSITLDQCTTISRAITSAIGANSLLEGDYRLEVSSPGIDRPLAHPWQYPKHVGRTLRVTVRRDDRTEVYEGTLVAVGEAGIELERTGGQPRVSAAFEDIAGARVRAPW